jgi:hypothetical protein
MQKWANSEDRKLAMILDFIKKLVFVMLSLCKTKVFLRLKTFGIYSINRFNFKFHNKFGQSLVILFKIS